MAGAFAHSHAMIKTVANALGEELLAQVAFVGGCTTGLLITDEFTKEEIRYTDDVDVIVNVMGIPQWLEFQQRLQSKGFTVSLEDDINCRMRLGRLKVDFMPDNAAVLGFTNRWYSEALDTAIDYQLDEETTIRILTPPFFVATKLEAYRGRGNDDPMMSHDIEDILNLFDGRKELVEEIRTSHDGVRAYIGDQIERLLQHSDLDYAIQSLARGDEDRADLIFERLNSVAAFKKL